MNTVCKENMCAGCMACLEVCGTGAIRIVKGLDAYNAVIDPDRCVKCGRCYQICQKNHPATASKPICWYEGWSTHEVQRQESSSGGLAAELEKMFVREGGIVCSCAIKGGRIGFAFAKNEEEVKQFSGSKYVKSNPEGIYRILRDYLRQGQEVLFVGLPCQVSAVRNFVGEKLQENLYTVDLICHGTPNPQILRKYLTDKGKNPDCMENLQFRNSNTFGLFENGQGIDRGTQDTYTTAFLKSIDYTENCYFCDYAKLERVSDLSLGDSWGSQLSAEEREKGVSLILCQTEKGRNLLQQAEVTLLPVDLQRAIDFNKQLSSPSVKHAKRQEYMNALQSEKSLNAALIKAEPNIEIKNIVKRMLVKLGIRR